MFNRIANLSTRHAKATLLLTTLLTVIAFGVGTQLFGKLQTGGYSDPNSDSWKATSIIHDTFKEREPQVVLIVDAMNQDINSVDGLSLEKSVANIPGVERTLSYWSANKNPAYLSKDGHAAYVFIYISSKNPSDIEKVSAQIQARFDGVQGSVRIYATGFGIFAHSANEVTKKDLAKSESLAIPITFILLIIVFGSLIASATPLLIAGIAIGGAFFAMWLVSLLTDVSIFGLNLITGLGTGLGIDYSLLIVNRFREELHAGASVDDAVSRTVHSAGRTVFFSGLTVAVTLGSLVIFPQYFLKTFGYAAITVVISAIVGALIPLPALLKILGHKVDKFVIRKSGITPKADGRWSAVARFVMARPKRVLVATLIIITVLIWPITSVKFSQVDERTLPKSDKAFIAAQVQKERFNGNFSMPIEIVAPSSADLSEQLSKLASLPNIVMVTQPKVVGGYQKAQAISSIPPRTPDGEAQIEKVRSQSWPTGTLIGGVAADYTDAQNGIKTHLPIVAVWVILAVLILLFLFTGSILLPIKAIILNAISLSAMIGILTWVFIDGNLSWLVGDFTNTGTIDTSMLVLIAVTTFGLSMDYELFLLSRIKEEHDAGRNTVDSVAFGLQKSARIITAAAMLLAVVFATFLISGVTMIKMLGFGVAFAILIDATIVRALLVPALMRLFGERNWWAPKSLKRLNILNH